MRIPPALRRLGRASLLASLALLVTFHAAPVAVADSPATAPAPAGPVHTPASPALGAPPAPSGAAPAPPAATPAPAPSPARPADPWRLLLGDAPRHGALVKDLEPGSPAAEMLRPGDVVVEVDREPVRDARDLRRYLASVHAGVPVLLELRRNGRVHFVGVEVPGPPLPPAPRPAAPAAPAAATAPPPSIIIVEVPAGGAGYGAPAVGFYGGGGGTEVLTSPNPPSFSAPGLPQTPGATFPPGPGTPAQAWPQLPGIEQPPGFQVPLPPPTPGLPPPGGPGGPPYVPPRGDVALPTPGGLTQPSVPPGPAPGAPAVPMVRGGGSPGASVGHH